MGSIDLKELFSRIRFLASNLRYNSRKHFYLTTLCIVSIIVLVFTIVFIRQRAEIIRKENIVKSFYADKSSEGESPLIEETGGLELAEKVFYKVHICGEVNEPGVYDVKPGLRLVDLIGLAGGATDLACLEAINLAMEASDGQRLYIPSFEEVEQGGTLYYGDDAMLYTDNTGFTGMGSIYGNIIDINTAGMEELDILPGIGPATAKKIIEHRSKYGNFKSKEELMDVNGIGPTKYRELEELIKI